MENLSAEINKHVAAHEVFSFRLFGYPIEVTDTIVTMWIIMVFMVVAAYFLTRKLKMVPGKTQNIVEAIVDGFNNIFKENIGHHWKHFSAYLGTLFLFLLICNVVSIFNIIPTPNDLAFLTGNDSLKEMHGYGLKPPTKDINIPAASALISIGIVLYAGIKFKKLKGWLKSFVEPIPLIMPFKILEYFIKPLSLCLRLFGNILAAFIIMELVYLAFPYGVPAILSLYFDLFDGILQAYIFVFLTSLYIGEAVELE